MISREDAYRQVYGRLARLGINVAGLMARNPPLDALEKVAADLERFSKAWNNAPTDDEAIAMHKRQREKDHANWRSVGLDYCFMCPCDLSEVPA